MQVIPVIDIRGGEVVAASRGDRARYRPLVTPLAASSDPVAVALGLRSLFPFRTLYVADLDGIEGKGADHATQQRLAEVWPGAELWIDDGSVGAERRTPSPQPSPQGEREPVEPSACALRSLSPWGEGQGEGAQSESRPPPSISTRIIGSESLALLHDYERACARAGPVAPLSLDFRGDAFVGPPELLADAALWPDRVIVMTLARVGSSEGPDLARLASIIARAQHRKVFAAGGVRNADDLRALRDVGAAGVLVATALHAGRIAAADIEAVAP